MKTQDPTVLCLVPKEAWVLPRWSCPELDAAAPRKLHACFTSICTYQDGIAARITDWKVAMQECAVTVQEMLKFRDLTELAARLAPPVTGIFLYSGSVPSCCVGKRPDHRQHAAHRYCYKTCMRYPHAEYAASCASSMTDLWGFDPDIAYGEPFMLGLFPPDDPVAAQIARIYDEWPDSKCEPMLPLGPSPSRDSTELVGLGRDMPVIGLFLPEYSPRSLPPTHLREALGDDAVLAGVDVEDFPSWLEEEFDLTKLVPLDRPLPFQE